jgi:hypothetical protein
MNPQKKVLVTLPIVILGLMVIIISGLFPPEPVKQLVFWRVLCGISFFTYAAVWSAWASTPVVKVTWSQDKE